MIKHLLKTSIVFVACINAYSHTFNVVDDLLHYGIELSVKLHCKNALRLRKESFLKNEMYKDSIYKVISKAFADCIMNKNEFKDVKKEEIVKFQCQDYDNYTNSNMNALLLYNCLHMLKFNTSLYEESNHHIIKKTKEKLIKIIGFSHNAKIKLDKAAYDIGQYLTHLTINDKETYTKNPKKLKHLFNTITEQISYGMKQYNKNELTKSGDNDFGRQTEIKLNNCVIITLFGNYDNNKHAKLVIRHKNIFSSAGNSGQYLIPCEEVYLTMDILRAESDIFIRYSRNKITEYEINDYLEIKNNNNIPLKNMKHGTSHPVIITPEMNTYNHIINFYWNYDTSCNKPLLQKITSNKIELSDDILEKYEIYIKFDPKVNIKLAPRAFENFGNFFKTNKSCAKYILYSDEKRQTVEAPLDCAEMFHSAIGFKSISINNWNLDNVTTMEKMCYNCAMLEAFAFGEQSAERLQTIKGCFMYCKQLKEEPKGKLICNSLCDVSLLYKDCSTLQNATLEWIISTSIKEMDSVFSECKQLKRADIHKNLNKLESMTRMFSNCCNLSDVCLHDYCNYSSGEIGKERVVYLYHMFIQCNSLKSIIVYNSHPKYVTRMEPCLSGEQDISDIPSVVKLWKNRSVKH